LKKIAKRKTYDGNHDDHEQTVPVGLAANPVTPLGLGALVGLNLEGSLNLGQFDQDELVVHLAIGVPASEDLVSLLDPALADQPARRLGAVVKCRPGQSPVGTGADRCMKTYMNGISTSWTIAPSICSIAGTRHDQLPLMLRQPNETHAATVSGWGEGEGQPGKVCTNRDSNSRIAPTESARVYEEQVISTLSPWTTLVENNLQTQAKAEVRAAWWRGWATSRTSKREEAKRGQHNQPSVHGGTS